MMKERKSRFPIIESEYASESEIAERKKRTEALHDIGVNIYAVDDAEEHENPYRAEAMHLIILGEEVPQSLKEKIKDYDREYEDKKLVKSNS